MTPLRPSASVKLSRVITRYGIIVATLSIALAAPYLWLRYFVLA